MLLLAFREITQKLLNESGKHAYISEFLGNQGGAWKLMKLVIISFKDSHSERYIILCLIILERWRTWLI